MSLRLGTILLTVALIALPSLALADDWMAVKVRGDAMQLVSGKWQALQRGDIVPDSRVVRTLASGRVEFIRGQETIDLDPNTQIQIFDRATAQPYTTIKQDFGVLSVEAQVQNVQHFEVDTPFLAAVVKGTRFVVTSGKNNANVAVHRGHVQVTDRANKYNVLISVGQSATVDGLAKHSILVTGSGKLPQVLDGNGNAVGTLTGQLQSTGGSSGVYPVVTNSLGGSNASGGLGITLGSNGQAGDGLVSVGLGGSNGNGGTSLLSASVGGSTSGSLANITLGSSGNHGSLASVTLGGSSSGSSLASVTVGGTGSNSALAGVTVGGSKSGSLASVTVGSSGGNGSLAGVAVGSSSSGSLASAQVGNTSGALASVGVGNSNDGSSLVGVSVGSSGNSSASGSGQLLNVKVGGLHIGL